ncbi:LuxR C-terminal-related transcriptional regulator [Streptomyces sp. NL15-2K]|uniref:LuxR C-terminal-related transcriptional regulator n=1 Tax=Streptomyces sp. NL15-2K TaxID=376149 RepID=UPI00209C17C1|nr:LuxR C-terminal-related transcriptional regulator [Streptomyces sp. NL15-2K]
MAPTGYRLRGRIGCDSAAARENGPQDPELLYVGLSDAGVARQLGLGHRTVQRRVGNLMGQLRVKGRVALGAKAQELGLVGSPGAIERPVSEAVPSGE